MPSCGGAIGASAEVTAGSLADGLAADAGAAMGLESLDRLAVPGSGSPSWIVVPPPEASERRLGTSGALTVPAADAWIPAFRVRFFFVVPVIFLLFPFVPEVILPVPAFAPLTLTEADFLGAEAPGNLVEVRDLALAFGLGFALIPTALVDYAELDVTCGPRRRCAYEFGPADAWRPPPPAVTISVLFGESGHSAIYSPTLSSSSKPIGTVAVRVDSSSTIYLGYVSTSPEPVPIEVACVQL